MELEKECAAIIFDETTRRYFTDFKSTFGIVVFLEKEILFITDDRYFAAAKKIKGVTLIKYRKNILFDILEEKGIKKVGVNLSLISAREYLNFIENGYEVIDFSRQFDDLISIKSEKELKYIKKACQIAEKSYKILVGQLREGMTEKQTATCLERLMEGFGAEGVSFDTIVAFGANSAVPHHETGNTKLKNGDVVLIDFGCKVKGYCSDMTRTLFFGKPDSQYINIYNAVLEAHLVAKSVATENTKAETPHLAAEEVLDKYGLKKYFTHSIGHGIGMNIHEFPYLKRGSEEKLKNGNVFSIEPGVYIENKFGIRIEDTVYLNGQAESFMRFTKSALYIENGKLKKIKTAKTVK